MKSVLRSYWILWLLLPALLAGLAAPLAGAEPFDPPQSFCPTTLELEILDLINAERAGQGLPPLAFDGRLGQASRLHSQDMADNNFFSHTGSDGSTFDERISAAGYTWYSAAENIAAGYPDAASVVQGWMNSPGHRANILGDYEHIGVGYAYNAGSTYGRYYTTDFGNTTDALEPPDCGTPTPSATVTTTATATSTPTVTVTPTATSTQTPTSTSTVTPTATITPTATPDTIFDDVPWDHWAVDYIEALYNAGYIGGCSTDPPLYCPDNTMSRAEAAVFVERGLHGGGFLPPQPGTALFDDVSLGSWAAKWADSLFDDGYTAGCNADPLMYCPWQGNTRAEASVFFLRMLYGSSYVPLQPVSPLFDDVPLDTWYAKWVHAAYDAGLLPACQTSPQFNFCPNQPLTRDWAAYMMVQAKGGLPLP
ncbi:MAG: CAP domain-containing protein [Anaerolineales bacterium]